MKKQFSTALHGQYDSYGKLKVKRFFMAAYGIYLLENPDRYAVDMIAYKDGKKLGYVEVEVREAWADNEFPFETLHIPERKVKLLKNDLKTVLVSVNKIGTRAFLCDGEVILSSPIKERSNKYVAQGEKFYLVDPSKIKLVELKER
jgi:hypothetical protein